MRHRVLAVFLFLNFTVVGSPQESVTKETVDSWMAELSNWGRWGEDDQRGTINLITPAKRREAAALVTEGFSVSLAREVEKEPAPDNPRPFGHKMLNAGQSGSQFVTDEYSVEYHGLAHTHFDTLAHMSFEGKSYNGFEMANVNEEGAPHLAVTNFKDGIFTKGVLFDIPHLKGVDWLEPRTAIYSEDLDAWEKMSGVRVEAGDVVFIYTGRWKRRDTQGAGKGGEGWAGVHASTAKWFHDRDIAMIGSDVISDVMPSGVEGVRQPIHQLMLVAMGTPIFDACDLEVLAEAARARGRWEFLITAAPIPVGQGTGSPLNPVATF